MEEYFASSRIDLGILIVDYRHPPTNNDITMANWFLGTGMPFVVIANKLDKIKKSALEGSLALIRETLMLREDVPVIPFSAEKGIGRDEVLEIIQSHVAERQEQ